MKIISLTSENVKKLSVVEIRPDGNLVQITGKNGQGKTSVLDSIWWALAGAGNVQSAPIRKGQTGARISLDLGEVVVTRTFKDREGDITTQIKVESADGFRRPSPQAFLDTLLSSLSFDPLAFTQMDAKQQFNELRRFVPDVDFDAIDRAHKADFDKRTDINRQVKQARAAADQIKVPEGLPDAEIDEAALTLALEQAGQHNSTLELHAERRRVATERLAELRIELPGVEPACEQQIADIHAAADAAIAEIDQEIATLRLKQDKIREKEISDRQTADSASGMRLTDIEQEIAAIEEKLAAAGDLPTVVDTGAIRAQIEVARATNRGIQSRAMRQRQLDNAAALHAQATALTDAMDVRTLDKQAKIAAAALPVPGIGFGDDNITLNGVPFDQASDAEQLRASIAIAMASNPKLRVIRVRDGSLLDEDGLKLLAEMADKQDCQIWIERVDSSGTVGFVLEDGHIKAPAQQDLLGAVQ